MASVRLVPIAAVLAGVLAAAPAAGASTPALDITPSPTLRVGPGQSAILPIGGFIEHMACWPAGALVGPDYARELEVSWDGRPSSIAVRTTIGGTPPTCPGDGLSSALLWSPPREGRWTVRQCQAPTADGQRRCLPDSTVQVGGASSQPGVSAPVISDLVQAPASVVAEYVKAGAARISWVPADWTTGWTPPPLWRATASPGGRSCETWGDAVEDSCVISGLRRGVNYAFTVSTVWGGLASPPSPPTPPAAWGVTPVTPQQVRVSTTASSARVSWTAPDSRVAGETRYSIARSQPGGATCRTSGTACVISGLRPGTRYAITVTAHGARRTTAESAPQPVLTKPRPQADPTPTSPAKPESSLS